MRVREGGPNGRIAELYNPKMFNQNMLEIVDQSTREFIIVRRKKQKKFIN
jgi:hypothetical protein